MLKGYPYHALQGDKFHKIHKIVLDKGWPIVGDKHPTGGKNSQIVLDSASFCWVHLF